MCFGLVIQISLAGGIPQEKVLDACSQGEGGSHKKGVGMLIVSLQGCKFRILVLIRVFWENAIIFSREGLVLGCT